MKSLRTKQTIENKNVRHLKFERYILTLCFLLFIVVGITGCTKEYTADDIKSYAKETLSIRRVTVDIIPHEYKDEDGYTDILWTVKDKKNSITFHVLDNTPVFFPIFQLYLNSNNESLKSAVYTALFVYNKPVLLPALENRLGKIEHLFEKCVDKRTDVLYNSIIEQMFLGWNSNREETAMKRKLIFGLSLVLIICIIFGVNNKKQNPEAATTNEKYYTCITIEEDDTLWTIAEEYCTEEYDSYQEYIDEVKFINNLTDDTLYYGGKLVIPYYAAPL